MEEVAFFFATIGFVLVLFVLYRGPYYRYAWHGGLAVERKFEVTGAGTELEQRALYGLAAVGAEITVLEPGHLEGVHWPWGSRNLLVDLSPQADKVVATVRIDGASRWSNRKVSEDLARRLESYLKYLP
jgi:hypothetical protein